MYVSTLDLHNTIDCQDLDICIGSFFDIIFDSEANILSHLQNILTNKREVWISEEIDVGLNHWSHRSVGMTNLSLLCA